MTAFKRALLGTTTVMFALSSMPAMAQNTGVVEEIVVTARKRTETLQEIPISVSAFSADKISELGVNNLESLSSYTSGFVFQNTAAGGAGGRQNPSIRFRGQGVQAENGAARAGAVFWNGTYISDGAGILPLMDLARVEVIKGPQTAFFGRNTFAGAVNFIPAEPGDEFAGKGSASFSPSNESSYNVTAAAGGPITDTFGLRLAAMIDRVGADWNYDNGDPAGQENTKSISANMVLKPSDSLKLKANGFYVDSDDTRALQGQSSDSPPGYRPPTAWVLITAFGESTCRVSTRCPTTRPFSGSPRAASPATGASRTTSSERRPQALARTLGWSVLCSGHAISRLKFATPPIPRATCAT